LLAGLRAFVQEQAEADYAQALKSSGLAAMLASGGLPFSYAKVRVVADDPMKILQESRTTLPPAAQPAARVERSGPNVLVSPFVPGRGGSPASLVAAWGESQGAHQLARLDRRSCGARRLPAVSPCASRRGRRTL
jgi:hypothetical protein